MNKRLLIALCFCISLPVWSDPQAECQAAAGSYLSGAVVSPPRFAHGKLLKGVELSHTHLTIKADPDGKLYDVAMDNVFADGYQKNQKQVPVPLSQIQVGDTLELCGQLYTDGTGIHWVHTNCGINPTPNKPDGWVKKLSDSGASDNYEDLTSFCYLWQ